MMLPSATPLLIVSPMMVLTNPTVAAAVLFLAGMYQLTPLKSMCLSRCQSPVGFMMLHRRAGTAGAFRMGVRHGGYCLGCCWALMLLLFVGGVMNLTVMVALTAFVIFEKVGPFGDHTPRISGGLLIAGSAWMLLSSHS